MAYILSLIVAFLMTVTSLVGLLYPSAIYPSDELRQANMSNDLINLLIGLPILLVPMWLTWRGKLVGLLSWPGALLYVLYNYTAYIFGIPVGSITLAFVSLALLSIYSVVILLKSIDRNTIQAQLSGAAPEKFAGWILVVFGSAFLFRAIGMLAGVGAGQAALPVPEIGTLVADTVLSILWISGGVLLLRRKPLGYVSGLGLLFAASALFIGLIAYLLLQPALTGAPLMLTDVSISLIMGLVCFIPTGLFIRGVGSKS